MISWFMEVPVLFLCGGLLVCGGLVLLGGLLVYGGFVLLGGLLVYGGFVLLGLLVYGGFVRRSPGLWRARPIRYPLLSSLSLRSH